MQIIHKKINLYYGFSRTIRHLVVTHKKYNQKGILNKMHIEQDSFNNEAHFSKMFPLFHIYMRERERERNISTVHLIAVDIWNAVKTNMTVRGCFKYGYRLLPWYSLQNACV